MENGDTPAEAPQDHYEELVVVDRAGRLHIPHEYLEQFQIKGRAQVEVTEDGILIRPTRQDRVEAEIAKPNTATAIVASEAGGVRNLLGRFGLRRGKK